MNRIPILVWFLIPAVLLLVLGIWLFSRNPDLASKKEGEKVAAAVSKPVAGTVEYPIIGREHIAVGTSGSGYNSNPPSSGVHWSQSGFAPANAGIYGETLDDEILIHNLEHGHIWISYKSDVGSDVVDKLKEIVKDDDWKVVLEPRDKNDGKIALVAWGRVLTMDEPDYDKIKDFIKTYRNRGPELTPM